MAGAQPSVLHISAPAHTGGERCPWCEQPIPHEKFAEVRSRIAEKERERFAERERALREESERARADAVASAREEERATAAAALASKLATLETARQAAEAKLAEQREALDKEKTTAVLAERAHAFDERQKLMAKVEALQKQLENKTAQEIGEGAEADLYEQLKAAFEGDRIRRVLKGTQGADVIHEVIHNGKVCGKIIYDSKNRNAWKSEFVTKLRSDQMSERAEHAVLSTNKFPAGVQQLHTQEGVIIAHPARVLSLVEVLRRHIVQTHELRLSNEQRDEKTAALYAFITSDRCKQLFEQVSSHTGKLLEIDAAEEKAHRLTWDRRAKLIHAVQRVRDDLVFEIERVLGTADNGPEDDPGVL
jgi:hypothetical protein